jgi:hypothetical protein
VVSDTKVGSVTGYDTASHWLIEHAPEWRIRWAEATLVASPFMGGPTEQRVQVTLVPDLGAKHARLYGDQVELQGEGRSHLEAVQRAIGALER